jgi:hypothetical protein
MAETPRPPYPPLRVVDPLNPPPGDRLEDHPQAWWLRCKLVTVLSEPRVHTLTTPGGAKLTLTTDVMLSPSKLRAHMLDAIGILPPLPSKKTPDFLREMWSELFSRREVITPVKEASDQGTINSDIVMVLRKMSRSDDPRDLELNAIVETEKRPGERFFNARGLYDRLRRISPVKLTPAQFYGELRELGCVNHECVRLGTWRGRAWSVPPELFADPPDPDDGQTPPPAPEDSHPAEEHPSGVHPSGIVPDAHVAAAADFWGGAEAVAAAGGGGGESVSFDYGEDEHGDAWEPPE